uniref:Ion transport domain-containing protein n=1 Tax=Timema cristinae TaxID=61476 RepID=A0A7R9CG21_TIMCR|nr:unnamed protein product [Timema cristinae]
MFLEILQTLIKVLIVFSILIIAFGLAFYILLSKVDTRHTSRLTKEVLCTWGIIPTYLTSQLSSPLGTPPCPLLGDHLSFRNVPMSLMRTFAMMLGEIDFLGTYVQPYYEPEENDKSIPFPIPAFFILGLFMVLMPILLMNLLIGLAVGDIESVRRNAQLKRLAMQVVLHTELERKLPQFLLEKVDKQELIEYPNDTKCKLGFLDAVLRKWFCNPFTDDGKLYSTVHNVFIKQLIDTLHELECITHTLFLVRLQECITHTLFIVRLQECITHTLFIVRLQECITHTLFIVRLQECITHTLFIYPLSPLIPFSVTVEVSKVFFQHDMPDTSVGLTQWAEQRATLECGHRQNRNVEASHTPKKTGFCLVIRIACIPFHPTLMNEQIIIITIGTVCQETKCVLFTKNITKAIFTGNSNKRENREFCTNCKTFSYNRGCFGSVLIASM